MQSITEQHGTSHKRNRTTLPRPTACRRAMLWRDPALLTACLVGLLLVLIACEKKEAPAPMGPPEVLVAEVAQQNVPIYEEWVAQLNGPVNADITPKVQGYLLKQNYQNGYFVKKGQLLFELDPRQYQAAVEEVQAHVEIAQAGLSEADNNVARDTPLAAQERHPAEATGHGYFPTGGAKGAG